jgi:hypothetical protein
MGDEDIWGGGFGITRLSKQSEVSGSEPVRVVLGH